MTAAVTAVDSAHRSTRRLLTVLLFAYLAFVVYGSLVPLNYVPMAWDEALRQFERVPYYELGIHSRADWVANGLLFIPLSFLSAALLPSHWPLAVRVAAAVLLWAAASALAVAIEFTQIFFPGRTVGLNDILAESVGAAVGLLLYAVTGRRTTAWLQGWWQREAQSTRLLRALHLYLAGVLFYAVMPLDLTISPVELLHKMNKGSGITLLPFSDWPREAAPLAYKAVTDLLLWLPLGLMWRLSGVPMSGAVARGLAAAALIETLQLFVYSRHSSATDIVMGGLGAWAGAWLAARLAPRIGGAHGPARSTDGSAVSARGAWLAWFAWLVLMLVVFWYPFDFRTDGSFLRAKLEGLDRPLLTGYYMGSEFRALTELLRKVLMFLPGGLAWALVVQRSATAAAPLRALGFVVPVLVAAIVEGGQLMLPDKVADFSDVLFESTGGWIGLLLGAWLLDAAPGTTSTSGVGRVVAGDRSSRSAPLGPGAVVLPSYARALAPWRIPPRDTWTATWIQDLLVVSLLAVAMVLAGRQPAMPYNVRELFDGHEGIVVAAVLAVVLWSLWSLPLMLLESWAARPESALWLVPGLPLVVAVPAMLMAAAMPEESIGDIVGTPVMGWPRVIEQGLRYAALHAAVLLASAGSAWSVMRLASGLRFELLPRWLIVVMVWAGPLHGVIVVAAATDNLTELMRDGGAWLSSVALFAGLMALFTAAFAVGAALAGLGRGGRTAHLLVVAALAWPLATALLWSGSETALTKYDKTFSAAQFLLSVDRDQYAPASVLWWRFLLASLGLTLAAALLQAPRWWRLARLVRASHLPAPPHRASADQGRQATAP